MLPETIGYHLRPAALADSARLYHWRNHPRVRAVMPFDGEIDPAVHAEWFPQALADPSRRMFVLEDRSGPVAAVVFLNVRPGLSASWGFYTAPREEISRARAIGAWLACEYAGLRYPFEFLDVETLHCEVLASHRLLPFRGRQGFLRTGERQVSAHRPPFIQLEMPRARCRAGRGFNLTVAIQPDRRDVRQFAAHFRTALERAGPALAAYIGCLPYIQNPRA